MLKGFRRRLQSCLHPNSRLNLDTIAYRRSSDFLGTHPHYISGTHLQVSRLDIDRLCFFCLFSNYLLWWRSDPPSPTSTTRIIKHSIFPLELKLRLGSGGSKQFSCFPLRSLRPTFLS